MAMAGSGPLVMKLETRTSFCLSEIVGKEKNVSSKDNSSKCANKYPVGLYGDFL